VVGNLLNNAVKYTPSGGRVILRACVEGSDLRVDVCDNGPGVPATDLPHVFEAFFRAGKTARETPGTGLGLSIASSIVQAHGGRIWTESKEGEGATFSFCIPLWSGEAEAVTPPAEA
jgi:signal transduction histidine kinase